MPPVVVETRMKDVVQHNFDVSVSAYGAYERRTRRFSALTRLLWAELAAHSDGDLTTVLDAGAGTGVSTTVLQSSADRVVPLDISREMLTEKPNPNRVQGDFDHLPFCDTTFDAVAYTASLFLVPDPAVAVDEATRVLRSGGVVGAVAPLGWFTDGEDTFDSLPRTSRSPTSTSEVRRAIESAGDCTTGTWSFPTTAEIIRLFHEIPAMAARLYPREDPDERVRKTRELLGSLEGTFEQRWRWVVARIE